MLLLVLMVGAWITGLWSSDADVVLPLLVSSIRPFLPAARLTSYWCRSTKRGFRRR